MADKYEIEIDGFELEVEIYQGDYKSKDFEIENLFDCTNDFIELENDIFALIMGDFEDDIKELIIDQMVAEREDF